MYNKAPFFIAFLSLIIYSALYFSNMQTSDAMAANKSAPAESKAEVVDTKKYLTRTLKLPIKMMSKQQ